MANWITAVIVFILSAVNYSQCYLETDGWVNIELYHALDHNNPEEFSYRGNISIPSLSSGLSTIMQEGLSNQQRKSLKILAQSNDFYRLRCVVSYGNGAEKQTFITSTKACGLVLAQLNDVLWMYTDGAGFITSITQTISSPEQDDCSSSYLSTEEDFNTDLLIRNSELGQLPDTASFIQKIDREREARERGDVRDNRGFFAKYWMYIVPVMLLVFISGATNQEPAK